MNKRVLLGITSAALVSGLIVGGLKATSSRADAPNTDPAITQALAQNEQELANHEARISTTEDNVTTLQNKPSSSSSSTQTTTST